MKSSMHVRMHVCMYVQYLKLDTQQTVQVRSGPSNSQHANLLQQLVVLLSNGEQVALNALEVVHRDPCGLLRENGR